MKTEKTALGQLEIAAFSVIAMKINTDHLPNAAGVYRITDCETGQFYIGASESISRRIGNWIVSLQAGTCSGAVQRAYDASKSKAFEVSVVELCDLGNLLDREEDYIQQLSPPLNQKSMIRMRDRHAVGPLEILPANIGPMSWAERRERRCEMVALLSEGHSVPQIARRFRVCTETVLIARRKHVSYQR